MDNAETYGDSVAIDPEGQRERSRMWLDGCERGRIGGSVELKDNDIGAGVPPSHTRAETAAVAQDDLGLLNVRQGLLGSDDDAFAP